MGGRKDLYVRMAPTVVSVDVYYEEDGEYDTEGAGILISEQGFVLTLSRVVLEKSDTKLRVVTSEKEEYKASVHRIDSSLGLAILEVCNSSVKFPYAQISEDFSIGDEIYGIGHPDYLLYSFIVGHISYLSRRYGEVKDSLKVMERANKIIELRARMKDQGLDHPDPSAVAVCYVSDLSDCEPNDALQLVQINNMHGDGMDGSSGTPFLDSDGRLIGLYFFLVREQCYGIHATTLKSFIERSLAADPRTPSRKRKQHNNQQRRSFHGQTSKLV